MNMALVKLCIGGYVRTEAVGAVQVDVDFDHAAETRTKTTRVMDSTGQNELLTIQTIVSTVTPNSDPNAVKRDNYIHDEIIAALREERDARIWEEPSQ